MQTIIRKANRADLATIVALLADDDLGATRELSGDVLDSRYVKAFELIDADPMHELMVIELDHQVVGTMQLTFLPYLTYTGGLRAQIESVRIGKRYQGKGLGKEMIQWAIKRSKVRGAHLVQLTTDKLRPAAIRFYESLGFKATHEGMKYKLE